METGAPCKSDMTTENRIWWAFGLVVEVVVVWITTHATSLSAATLVLALVATALALALPPSPGWPRYACSTIVAFNGGAFTLLASLAFGAVIGKPSLRLAQADTEALVAIGFAALAAAVATGLAQHRAELAAQAKATETLARLLAEARAPQAAAEKAQARRWPIVAALLVAAVLRRRPR